MRRVLRPSGESPTPAFRVLAPVLGAAPVALWQVAAIDDRGALWGGAFLGTMAVAWPLLLLVRRRAPWALAAAVLAVAAQTVALGVWASAVSGG